MIFRNIKYFFTKNRLVAALFVLILFVTLSGIFYAYHFVRQLQNERFRFDEKQRTYCVAVTQPEQTAAVHGIRI